jgi:hypothetical protein
VVEPLREGGQKWLGPHEDRLAVAERDQCDRVVDVHHPHRDRLPQPGLFAGLHRALDRGHAPRR